MPKVLILGASSWIGYLLVHRMVAEPGWEVHGTAYRSEVAFPDRVRIARVAQPGDYGRLLQTVRPEVVVNLLRGEEEPDYHLHLDIVHYGGECGALYAYASSALCLDGYRQTRLTEDLPPRSVSPYGIFKGRCEEALRSQAVRHLVLRFASIQGFVPHKPTRNLRFLQRLAAGETVRVDHPVWQNRLYDGVLVEALAALVQRGTEGVVHLGTDDASTELDFLRCQAEAFGYDPRRVVEGGAREVNLVTIPGRIYELFGDRFRCTEADTLHALINCPGLQGSFAPGHPRQPER